MVPATGRIHLPRTAELCEVENQCLFNQAAGVENFIEVGPGRVLSGLLRRTDKAKKFSNIEDKKSADALLAAVAPR